MEFFQPQQNYDHDDSLDVTKITTPRITAYHELVNFSARDDITERQRKLAELEFEELMDDLDVEYANFLEEDDVTYESDITTSDVDRDALLMDYLEGYSKILKDITEIDDSEIDLMLSEIFDGRRRREKAEKARIALESAQTKRQASSEVELVSNEETDEDKVYIKEYKFSKIALQYINRLNDEKLSRVKTQLVYRALNDTRSNLHRLNDISARNDLLNALEETFDEITNESEAESVSALKFNLQSTDDIVNENTASVIQLHSKAIK